MFVAHRSPHGRIDQVSRSNPEQAFCANASSPIKVTNDLSGYDGFVQAGSGNAGWSGTFPSCYM